MSQKKRVPVNLVSTALNTPFEKLSGEGLRPGEAQRQQPQRAAPARLGRVVLRRETSHRGGKTVIVVYDFPPQISDARIEELASRLRKACGCGGTTKDRTIEIQGDQPVKVRALLEAEGFLVAGIR